MDELFERAQDEPSGGDINLCIFPHLKQVLVVDLREDTPLVQVVNADDIFDSAFFEYVEREFGRILREETEYPFSHMMNISMRVEELIREAGTTAILQKLGQTGSADEQPMVAVFVISGSALSPGEKEINRILHALLGREPDTDTRAKCVQHLTRLVTQERSVMKKMERDEMREALEEESPNFYTLWQQRN